MAVSPPAPADVTVTDRSEARNSVPVTVVTGFLGSGKTTVLNRLLRVPELTDTAVIINEFGEVSLDHLLIEQAIENAVLLKNGCICCTVRGDILDTIDELFRRRDTGELPWFRRIAIETTGLADPAPVVHTLVDTSQPCHLDGIVVTADAMNIATELHEHEEARDQIAFADRILLTKTDLVTRREADAAEQAIRARNDRTPIRRIADSGITADDVFGLGPDRHPAHWLRAAPPSHEHGHDHHAEAIVLRAAEPIRQAALALWLNSLLSLHGAAVLRLKGIARIEGSSEVPLVLQAVHHVLHAPGPLPPAAAATWAGTGAEIVVIHRGLSETGLRESFAAALAAGRVPSP
jgi:G3E family GTPase